MGTTGVGGAPCAPGTFSPDKPPYYTCRSGQRILHVSATVLLYSSSMSPTRFPFFSVGGSALRRQEERDVFFFPHEIDVYSAVCSRRKDQSPREVGMYYKYVVLVQSKIVFPEVAWRTKIHILDSGLLSTADMVGDRKKKTAVTPPTMHRKIPLD